MKITPGKIPGVLLIEPKVHADERGFLFESFNRREFARQTGLALDFVQENHSRSAHHVLRGLHYQVRQSQGKLVRVVAGEVFDVAVDLSRESPTFGQWCGHVLSRQNQHQLWIPPGFAHGFLVLSDGADVLYKCTHYYAPADERCIVWNDPTLGIDWPLNGAAPVLSVKDMEGLALGAALAK